MAIVIRAALLWIFLLIVMRALGKKELAQISAFEFVLLVVMGDLIQQGVTAQDTSITAAALAVSTLGLLTIAASYLSFRWNRVAPLVEGVPVVLVERGRVYHEVLRIERLTLDEVKDAAREQGIDDLRSVRLGVLEADGTFAFIRGGEPTQGQRPKTGEQAE
jgi:uncharacterized membrane protein YcaP (DUF421 family)